jgi:hypothetical protein
MGSLAIADSFEDQLTDEAIEMEADGYDHGRPRPPYQERWSCEANNTRRSGPYTGEGPTERAARADALSQCHAASVFRCWVVPNSCYPRW